MKKKLKINFIGMLLLTLSVLPSCDSFLDINNDPFLPQSGPPHLYFPQLLYAMGEGQQWDSRYIGNYVQNYSLSSANYRYDLHASRRQQPDGGLTNNQVWRNHYWSIGSNLNQIETEAEARGFGAQYKGITKAIRAWSWLVATDQFGEMPLTDAWDNSKKKFAYNSQEEIYMHADKLADEAISLLQSSPAKKDPKLIEGDLLYKGDAQKWLKFAYAVKARLANRYSNKSTYDPAKVIALADKAFGSNTDNAAIVYTSNPSDNSSYFSFMGPTRGNLNSQRPSKMIIDLLNGSQFGTEDFRISFLLNANKTGQYVGILPGKGTAGADVPNMYNKFIFTNIAPYPLMTYAEMQFLKAEANFKAGNKAAARAAMAAGIKAHGEQCGAPAAEADAFIAKLPAADALKISDIMGQKYIAMFGITGETWTDLRRYNYDPTVYPAYNMPETFAANNNGKPVYRCPPTAFSEEDWNRENLAAIGGMEIDYHTKKPWFAEK